MSVLKFSTFIKIHLNGIFNTFHIFLHLLLDLILRQTVRIFHVQAEIIASIVGEFAQRTKESRCLVKNVKMNHQVLAIEIRLVAKMTQNITLFHMFFRMFAQLQFISENFVTSFKIAFEDFRVSSEM
jgi:hypothetical protein